MKWPLKNKIPSLPLTDGVGDFAFRRSFYYHPGIDIYCDLGQEVQAIEDGIIVHIENFTGPEADPPSPWWNETWSILIEGKSGVLGYCELKPIDSIHIGLKVHAGDVIANIIPVLKKDKGNGTTMLHFEKYATGTRHHVTWVLDTPKPEELENPRKFLENFTRLDFGQ
jgi:hypothetical protein